MDFGSDPDGYTCVGGSFSEEFVPSSSEGVEFVVRLSEAHNVNANSSGNVAKPVQFQSTAAVCVPQQ